MNRIAQVICQVFVGDIILKLVPVQKNVVMFSSFYGQHYSDGPRSISESLHLKYPKMKIYWAFNNPGSHDVPEYVVPLKMGSLKHMLIKSIASCVVTNVYHQAGFLGENVKSNIVTVLHLKLEQRKKQRVITTWHGTPLKKMGNDEIGATKVKFICNSPCYYVVGNKFEHDIMMRLTDYKMTALPWGGRNYELSRSNHKYNEIIRKKIGIAQNEKVVLLAPTFRYGEKKKGVDVYNSGLAQLDILNFDVLTMQLKEIFGGSDWVLICRFHNLVEQGVDWKLLSQKYNNKIINGNLLEDITEFYRIADLVITDYSSVMFDYMDTYKPIILLCHDYENYMNNERGFSLDIEELPFMFATNYEEVVNSIRQFKQDVYERKIDEFKKRLGYYAEENVMDKIIDFIHEGEII